MKKKKSKTKLLHQYYSYTGFYTFVGNSLKKAATPVIFIIVGLYLINEYVFTIDDGLLFLTQTFSRTGIIITFFISETLLGLIPPEIFIAWSKKTASPIINLSILATLSYTGGILSYFIGKTILKINAVKNYLEVKMAKASKKYRKVGRVFNSYWRPIACSLFNYMCSCRNDQIPFKRSYSFWTLSLCSFCFICMGNF